MTELERKIETLLDSEAMSDLVPIWNEYCGAVNYYDDRIENMDDFDDLMAGAEPHEIAAKISYGSFNYADDWFAFDGYGNLVSFDVAADKHSPIDTRAMAEYAAEHDYDFGSPDIRDLLDAAAEQEE